MAKYRKKPVEVDAFRLGHEEEESQWALEAQDAGTIIPFLGFAVIKTPGGEVRADYGDWIIRGVEGELYPCKDSVFQKTYEKADDNEKEEWDGLS